MQPLGPCTGPGLSAGCTIVEPRCNLDEDSYEMARVAERIGCLARHVEELNVPIMAVESGALDRLDVSDLCGKWIALCGLYGGYCVRESIRWLRARRIRVIQVRDAIVWPPGEKPSGSLATTLSPCLYHPPWLMANIGA